MKQDVPIPYLDRKGLAPRRGAFLATDGKTTCIPAVGADGKLWSMLYIQEDGTKRFAKNSRKEGCFHPVGGMDALRSAPAIVIAEGYATAGSISDAIGHATVAAFDSGNLVAVATALKDKYPDKTVIIAGDDDLHLLNHPKVRANPGREKAEKAAQAVGGKAVFPVFAPGEREKDMAGFTDFNSEKTELSAREVEEAVRAAYTRPDEATALRESVEAKCALLSVPGLEVEFDPEEAEQCSAFMENALSEEEAVDASQDVISY